jgi:hypothetical protein
MLEVERRLRELNVPGCALSGDAIGVMVSHKNMRKDGSTFYCLKFEVYNHVCVESM